MIEPQSLLERIKQHDQDALAAVHDYYFDRIFQYLSYRLNEPEAAADLAGEVFLSLIKALKAGKAPQKSLGGWLYTVARNLAADYIKAQTRTVPLFDNLAAEEASLTDRVHRAQLRPVLNKALLQLTEDQQHVIALRFGQGLNLAETAFLMDKSVGAVKALQHRALASLARLMPQEVYNDG